MTTTPIDTERQALLARIAELEVKCAAADAEVTRLAQAVVQPGGTIDCADFNALLGAILGVLPNVSARTEIDNLIAYIDARLVADMTNMQYAKRYRWLRARTVAWNVLRPPEWKTGDKLDAAIDAAMAKDTGGGE